MDHHQEREGDVGEESPEHSPNDEEMSDGDVNSGAEHDDVDSGDDLRNHVINSRRNDVLEKLKMQVRDIGALPTNGVHPHNQQDSLNYSMNNRPQEGMQFSFPIPFTHPAAAFLPPMPPAVQPTSSGSSHSSEGSASSHTWSFEEQFKQVRQLYELSDDPRRKEFLDDLFSFMQKRGSPINRLPIMAKSVLDLYELYNLVVARGGLVDVINKKLWQEIIKGLHLPSSITSAAFTLRTQYMKFLYPYECEKLHLSSPSELQAAIDGNRREGRRSNYSPYESMGRFDGQNNASPLNVPAALVSVAQQQQLAARINSVMAGGIGLVNGTHHAAHPQPGNPPMAVASVPGLPNLPHLPNIPPEFESRVVEYMKLIGKEMSARCGMDVPPRQMADLSPPNAASSPLSAVDVQQRLSLFNLYNNNQSEVEQKEPINLSDTPLKREPICRDSSPSPKRIRRPEKVDTPNVSVSSLNIKIENRQDSGNQIVVSLELDGVTYNGVLFSANPRSSSNTAVMS